MKPDFDGMVAEEMAAIGMKHDGPLANLLATAYGRIWDSAFNAGLERAAEIADKYRWYLTYPMDPKAPLTSATYHKDIAKTIRAEKGPQ